MPLRLKGNTPRPGEADRRYYMLDVAHAGRRERLSSGTRDRHLAERREQAVLDAMRADPDITRVDLVAIARGAQAAAKARIKVDGSFTLGDARDFILGHEEGWKRARSREDYARNLRLVLPLIGGEKAQARSVTKAVLEELRDKLLAKKNTEATVNRKVFAVMKMLRFAREHEKLTADPPRIKLFDEADRARQFVPDYDTEAALLEAIRTHAKGDEEPRGGRPRKDDGDLYADLLVVCVEAGLRLGEGIGVRWPQVEGECLRLWDTAQIKNSLAGTVPLTALAKEAIERQRGRPLGPFVGCRKNRAQQLFARARKSIGLGKECVIHSFRHAAGTRLLEETDNIKLVQEFLRHKDIRSTLRYAKVGSKMLREGVGKLEKRRDKAAGSGDAETPDSGTGNRSTLAGLPGWNVSNPLSNVTITFGAAGKSGVDDGTRTHDNRNHNPVL